MDPRVPKEVVDAAAAAASAASAAGAQESTPTPEPVVAETHAAQPDLSDESGEEGMRLRDLGMASALSHEEKWAKRAKALVLIERAQPHASELTFIGEDIAAMVLREGGGTPEIKNAIGGFVGGLARQKLIVKLLERRFMKNPDSHGRDSPVYRYLYPNALAANDTIGASDPLADVG